jgi:hypothetical protein
LFSCHFFLPWLKQFQIRASRNRTLERASNGERSCDPAHPGKRLPSTDLNAGLTKCSSQRPHFELHPHSTWPAIRRPWRPRSDSRSPGTVAS